MWGQVGYYIWQGSTPYAFYSIWDLTSNTMLVYVYGIPVTEGYHTFSMFLASGTTWNYAMDDKVLGSYDMRSSTSSLTYPVYTVSEEMYSSPFAFSNVYFSTAMQVLRSGTWTPTTLARSYGSAWGVQGQAQEGNLAANQIRVGSDLQILPISTVLWSQSGPDTTAPSVTITSPNGGSTVSGIVAVKVSATDNVGVVKTELYIDGTLYTSSTTSPYVFTWDTSVYSDGVHTLMAKSYDAAGNVGSSTPIKVTVSNGINDRLISVIISSPTAGSIIKGSVPISGTANSVYGIQRITISLDGKLLAIVYSSSFSYRWNSKSVKNGQHTVNVQVIDNNGNTASASVTVTVKNNSKAN